MASQGEAINKVALLCQEKGWIVGFKCLPNQAHRGAVPIPMVAASSAQRYPDIVAFKGSTTKLVEVEPRFDAAVTANIIVRFAEQVQALGSPATWHRWRELVARNINGVILPADFLPQCELVVLQPVRIEQIELKEQLEKNQIRLLYYGDYHP